MRMLQLPFFSFLVCHPEKSISYNQSFGDLRLKQYEKMHALILDKRWKGNLWAMPYDKLSDTTLWADLKFIQISTYWDCKKAKMNTLL